MYVEQLRWLPAIPCPKQIHLPPTHFAFLEEGVFLAKMMNEFILYWLKCYGIKIIKKPNNV
ncbi:hypothetical protein CN382_28530 [Bacillus cereus]|nr:hypothetical protein CON06_31400 [Bacillus cereus]PFA03843.1 hypothetical protein CN382_28530 [Bacillus cereus]